MKKVAVINDISGFGRCSLSAAIPVISALGVQCCPLVTGVLSNQTGYDNYYMKELTDEMELCISQWKKFGVHFDAVLTGFIANSRQGKIISEFIDEFADENTIVVVDPVMSDGDELCKSYDDKTVEAVFDLVKKADIITPNFAELCLLCGENSKAIRKLSGSEISKKVMEMSALQSANSNKIVITTGVSLESGKISSFIFERGNLDITTQEKFGGKFSGTGDIFASFLTAMLVNGASVKAAVQASSRFISQAARQTPAGRGENAYYPDGIHFEKVISENLHLGKI